jgi:hypothetical protein
MRKVLIATIAAMVLFAVGAFAATLTVTSENIASGTDPIEVCGDAEVDFNTVAPTTLGGDWTVGSVTVGFSGSCNGYGASVAIQHTGGPTMCTHADTVQIAANTINLTCAGTPTVGSVTGASVLVDGELLTVISFAEAHD